MKETLKLNILTPEKQVFTGDITELITENYSGSFGILPNHTGMITVLKPAVTVFKEPGGQVRKVFTSSGVLRIKDNIINIMCEASEWPEEVDVKRAEEAKKRSEMRLAKQDKSEIDDRRAELALVRALMRIKLKQK